MFFFTKGMGHEKHMVLLVSFLDLNDHLNQMLNHISKQERQFFKKIHQDAHGLVKSIILNYQFLIKLAILIWLVSLLGYLPTNLNMSYLLTFIST